MTIVEALMRAGGRAIRRRKGDGWRKVRTQDGVELAKLQMEDLTAQDWEIMDGLPRSPSEDCGARIIDLEKRVRALEEDGYRTRDKLSYAESKIARLEEDHYGAESIRWGVGAAVVMLLVIDLIVKFGG